MEPIIMMYNNQ